MKSTALYHSGHRDETMSLHAAGYRGSRARAGGARSNLQHIEATDADGAVDMMLDEELREMGYDENSRQGPRLHKQPQAERQGAHHDHERHHDHAGPG